jgi:hypothetical protein
VSHADGTATEVPTTGGPAATVAGVRAAAAAVSGSAPVDEDRLGARLFVAGVDRVAVRAGAEGSVAMLVDGDAGYGYRAVGLADLAGGLVPVMPD